jgi:hypothetical protein
MGATARRRAHIDEPPIDAAAVERSLARERARRRARIEHRQEQKRARRRFYGLLLGLLVFAVFLGVTIWDQIQNLFGL